MPSSVPVRHASPYRLDPVRRVAGFAVGTAWHAPGMNVDEVLLTGLDRFGGVRKHLTPENADAKSPCNAWTARGVAGHVLTVLDSAAVTLRGENYDWSSAPDPTEVGGDDQHSLFLERANAARAALVGTALDTPVETPMGEMTIGQRLSLCSPQAHSKN